MLDVDPLHERKKKYERTNKHVEKVQEYLQSLPDSIEQTTGRSAERVRTEFLRPLIAKHIAKAFREISLREHSYNYLINPTSTDIQRRAAAELLVAQPGFFDSKGSLPLYLRPLAIHALLRATREAQEPSLYRYAIKPRKRKQGTVYVPVREKAPDGFVPARDLPLFVKQSELPALENSAYYWIQARFLEILNEEIEAFVTPVKETLNRLAASNKRGRPKGRVYWESSDVLADELRELIREIAELNGIACTKVTQWLIVDYWDSKYEDVLDRPLLRTAENLRKYLQRYKLCWSDLRNSC